MAVENSLPVALWAIPVSEFGGVARHATDVARAGLPGYELKVLVADGALANTLDELGNSAIRGEFGTSAGFIKSFNILNQQIEQLRPAVVHSHLAYADIVACAVVVSRRLRRIVQRETFVPALFTTEHGIAGNDAVYHSSPLKARGRELIHRARLMLTNHAIAVSQSTAGQMKRKWGARNVEVIFNGVDAPQTAMNISRVTSKNPHILSLARLAPEKGLEVLIEAFAELRNELGGATLEIAGEGSELARLEALVARLGISDAVRFPGFVDASEAMSRADVLVQLSVWENLSYTLLDAKALGLKIVATDVGGNAEILDESELVPSLAEIGHKNLRQAVVERIKQQLNEPGHKSFEWLSSMEMAIKIAESYRKEKQK